MRQLQTVLFSALLLVSSLSFADNYKVITETIDADDLEQLRIEFSVGELDIEVWDGESIELEIELRAERNWFSFRRRKVEDIELEMRVSGEELFLGIDENNLNQDWLVKVPANIALELEIGVGDVRVEGLENNLSADLGVGDLEIVTATENYDRIHASVGVGDATLRGFGSGTENERSFVSADAHYQGKGEYRITVEVGVGDARVRLQ